MNWESFTPKIISTLRRYSPSQFKSDLVAGFIVAIVALPLSMALGIASGAPPEQGLVTAIIAGSLISLLGGSRVQIGGPTGAFVVVVFNVIQTHGYDGLLVATFIAGFTLILCGYLRLGGIVKFIPQPVVVGFTSAIAIIIASTQIKNFFGLKLLSVPPEFIHQWSLYFTAFKTLDFSSIIVGLGSLLTILILLKYAPKLPGFLFALLLSSVAVLFLGLPVETIGLQFPKIASGLTFPHLPPITLDKTLSVLPSGFTIAFLAGMEALLSAVVSDGMTGFKHRPNQELIGQGVANIGSALFGGLPATGAIARTATNVTAGGKTPIAGIVHALLILLFVIFCSPLIAFVPMPGLAAILFIVAWRMGEFHRFFRILLLSLQDGFLMILTFLLTLFVDLTVAIGVGVALSSLLFMMRMSESIEISFGKKVGVEREIDQREELPEGIQAFWIAGPIFFGIAERIPNLFKKIGQLPKVLIIRMRLVPFLDTSGAAALQELVKQCNITKIQVIISALQPQPTKVLKRLIGEEEAMRAVSFDQALKTAKTLIKTSE